VIKSKQSIPILAYPPIKRITTKTKDNVGEYLLALFSPTDLKTNLPRDGDTWKDLTKFIKNLNKIKKNQIIYKIKENDEECYINIHTHYKSQLNAYGKKFIDPFCRGKDRILFKVSESQCVLTNLSQLNFFRWAVQYNVLQYIDKYYTNIVKDMTETLSNTPSSNKRRIFASSSGKTMQRYDEGIDLDISHDNQEKNINIISKN
jgi:hypothetical protein